jgi:transposase
MSGLPSSRCRPTSRAAKRIRTETLCFSPYLYRARNLVERFFNNIRHCRREAMRYNKLAANYPAFVPLAWLRVNEPTSE